LSGWQRRGRDGQGLVEFALVLPLLLFLFMAIVDFSRVLFTFAQASNSLRQALRYGVIIGEVSGSPNYLDCDGMRDAASSVYFASSQTVTIQYASANSYPTSLPADGNCAATGEVADSELENGDLLRIETTTTVDLITPLLSSLWPRLTFTMEGHRTIVKKIVLPRPP
jgi:Flp pilus assembly protein TadG